MLLCRREAVNDADTEFEDEEQEAFLPGDEPSVVVAVVQVIPVVFVGDEDDDGRSEETKETTNSSCKSSVRGGGDVFGRGGGIGLCVGKSNNIVGEKWRKYKEIAC